VRSSDVAPQLRIDGIVRDSTGRRSDSVAQSGRYVGSRLPDGKARSIAIDATIRAAAPHQRSREGDTALIIEESDVREKVYECKVGCTILFVVDASGSMGARKRMSASKGAVLSLLTDAYQKRDRVGLISFRAERADLLVQPTSSVDLAKKNMDVMPTGGRTPLSRGLMLAFRTFDREIKQHPHDRMVLVLISDGKGNTSMSSMSPLDESMMIAAEIGALNVSSLVLDTETGAVRLGYSQKLAQSLRGRCMALEDIESSVIASSVRQVVG
jgi:magnesium chelatase subunit D